MRGWVYHWAWDTWGCLATTSCISPTSETALQMTQNVENSLERACSVGGGWLDTVGVCDLPFSKDGT